METVVIDKTRIDAAHISAADDRQIELSIWRPDTEPRGVIQVLHGLAEHIARYDRFARECTARGYAVVGHNHRGHGEQAAGGLLGHFADRDGMMLVVDDAERVFAEVRRQFPAAPIVLMGHSMGSYIAQLFVMRRAPDIAALILSGSTWPNQQEIRMARMLGKIMRFFRGTRRHSRLFDEMIFKKYNKTFAPNRTGFDWLSRDEAEVDRYIEDRLCGSRSSYGLWLELFNTLIEISERGATARVAKDLPMLITGGAEDPVGGARPLARLAAEYEASGHERVTLKLYADGRHEMLNETNRDAVTDDILSWIDTNVSRTGVLPAA